MNSESFTPCGSHCVAGLPVTFTDARKPEIEPSGFSAPDSKMIRSLLSRTTK
jgi:hypothetical protein